MFSETEQQRIVQSQTRKLNETKANRMKASRMSSPTKKSKEKEKNIGSQFEPTGKGWENNNSNNQTSFRSLTNSTYSTQLTSSSESSFSNHLIQNYDYVPNNAEMAYYAGFPYVGYGPNHGADASGYPVNPPAGIPLTGIPPAGIPPAGIPPAGIPSAAFGGYINVPGPGYNGSEGNPISGMGLHIPLPRRNSLSDLSAVTMTTTNSVPPDKPSLTNTDKNKTNVKNVGDEESCMESVVEPYESYTTAPPKITVPNSDDVNTDQLAKRRREQYRRAAMLANQRRQEFKNVIKHITRMGGALSTVSESSIESISVESPTIPTCKYTIDMDAEIKKKAAQFPPPPVFPKHELNSVKEEEEQEPNDGASITDDPKVTTPTNEGNSFRGFRNRFFKAPEGLDLKRMFSRSSTMSSSLTSFDGNDQHEKDDRKGASFGENSQNSFKSSSKMSFFSSKRSFTSSSKRLKSSSDRSLSKRATKPGIVKDPTDSITKTEPDKEETKDGSSTPTLTEELLGNISKEDSRTSRASSSSGERSADTPIPGTAQYVSNENRPNKYLDFHSALESSRTLNATNSRSRRGSRSQHTRRPFSRDIRPAQSQSQSEEQQPTTIDANEDDSSINTSTSVGGISNSSSGRQRDNATINDDSSSVTTELNSNGTGSGRRNRPTPTWQSETCFAVATPVQERSRNSAAARKRRRSPFRDPRIIALLVFLTIAILTFAAGFIIQSMRLPPKSSESSPESIKTTDSDYNEEIEENANDVVANNMNISQVNNNQSNVTNSSITSANINITSANINITASPSPTPTPIDPCHLNSISSSTASTSRLPSGCEPQIITLPPSSIGNLSTSFILNEDEFELVNGCMFNIHVKGGSSVVRPKFRVNSIDILLEDSNGDNIPIQVWTKSGGYQRYEDMEDEWINIFGTSRDSDKVWVEGNGPDHLSNIDEEFFTGWGNIGLWPDQTRAFYVTIAEPGRNSMIVQKGVSEGRTFMSNSDLEITDGTCFSYPFQGGKDNAIPMRWLGSIQYENTTSISQGITTIFNNLN